MPKILVTGSSGLIGTALCEKLLDLKYGVAGVDIRPNSWSPKVQAVTQLADLRNPSELHKLPNNIDCVVHLAANPYVFHSVQEPQLAFDNTLMTINALEFCRRHSIPRLVFASSREVYGNTAKRPLAESEAFLENTESPYAASKMAGEAFVHAYHKCYGLGFQILRFSNVYGKYDTSDRLVPQLFRRNSQNQDVTIFGKKSLPFTHIDDTVEAIALGIKNFEKAGNNCFNIAHPESVEISRVAELFRKKMGSKGKILKAPTRPGEVEFFVANTSKTEKVLGFKARIGIEEGIEKTIEWYKANT